MGLNAKAGLIVGVLTGTGTANYLLDKGADAIVPNVEYLLRLLGSSSMKRRPSSASLISISSGSESELSRSESELSTL